MGTAREKTRVGYYDWLRIAAMAGVILIHVCALFATDLAAGGQKLGPAWHLANLLNSFSRPAVPLYLMITGALLLPRDDSLSLAVIGRRRIVRVAVPLLFWSAVYILLKTFMVEGYSITGAITALVHEPAEVHLWYLYALIAIYLLLPLLRLIVKHASQTMILYIIGLWVLFSSLWRAAAGLIPALALPDYANLDILAGYVGYVLLGHVLATIKKVPSALITMGIYVAGGVVTTAATWIMTGRAGELNGVFYQYFMPNVLVMAAALFLAFRKLGEARDGMRMPGKAGKVVSALSSLSFGVYLIHEVFLRVLQPLMAGMFNTLAIIVLAAAVFVLSLAASFLLMQIPYVRFVTLGEPPRRSPR